MAKDFDRDATTAEGAAGATSGVGEDSAVVGSVGMAVMVAVARTGIGERGSRQGYRQSQSYHLNH